MKVEKTKIDGLIIVQPTVFNDNRGYFFESYQSQRYIKAGIAGPFVQDNESYSQYGVVRGLHYQLQPYAQAKLVRVILGAVLDVAVDLRKNSKTFGDWFGIELSAENKKQLYIPQGFAHGFSVLSKEAILTYKCDNYYNKESERGIIYNDADLSIDWKIPKDRMIASEKDIELVPFKEAEFNF